MAWIMKGIHILMYFCQCTYERNKVIESNTESGRFIQKKLQREGIANMNRAPLFSLVC